ncbi:MAG: (2Fe-2S)-binding protein, partial [Clostridia bacterium]
CGLELKENKEFNPNREEIVFMELSQEEKADIIKKDPRYGKIVCRCESITEGEIVNAIHRCFGTITLDGVKRRCRPGMGRCQGGFCGPKVQEIIARELEIPMENIYQEKDGSYILVGKTK